MHYAFRKWNTYLGTVSLSPRSHGSKFTTLRGAKRVCTVFPASCAAPSLVSLRGWVALIGCLLCQTSGNDLASGRISHISQDSHHDCK
ncbi:hypothetical protein L211DRAFT_102647 [Terfezia boudieri ATCC MYA-4762]|uniref:Uncharacterized protein n=1 Tax=Terfezia boudieri ATCC MYA-4762 TaxID=1051890 RepID=A0A3N4LQK5_9PEZI|nr:hypothetical protein L211DRAFT_102647 [Terfezia boudieri ATCC MYA-4762]